MYVCCPGLIGYQKWCCGKISSLLSSISGEMEFLSMQFLAFVLDAWQKKYLVTLPPASLCSLVLAGDW
jgi:hypothetical protein